MNGRRWFWSLLLAVGGVSLFVVRWLVPLAVRAPDPVSISNMFLAARAQDCAPEPVEQVRFMVSVVLPVGLFGLAVLLLRNLGAFDRGATSRGGELPSLAVMAQSSLAIVAQCLVVSAGAWGILYEVKYGTRYPFLDVSALAVMAILATLGLAVRSSSWDRFAGLLRWRGVRLWSWLPFCLALFWTVDHTLTGLYREHDVSAWPFNQSFHLPYVMAEFAAVLNGRTPLVDYFPQYQTVSPLLLAPLFRIIGFNVTTFSAVMFSLSTVGFLLVYSALTRVCRSSWLALALFVPCVGISFCGMEAAPSGYVINPFTYYAVGPLRYWGVFLLARLAVWYLEKPVPSRLALVAGVGSLVALNNLDFGLPAAVGVLACGILYPPALPVPSFLRRIGAAGLYLLAGASSFGLYLVLVRATRGAWPELASATDFQRTFAMFGYFMIPAPDAGLYWVIYLTLIAAVLIPVYEVFSSRFFEIGRQRRVLGGALAFWGIGSVGALAYYMGRSHALVLQSVFCAWAFTLAHLVYRALGEWRGFERRCSRGGALASALPMTSVFTLASLVVPAVFDAPNPISDLERLALPSPPSDSRDRDLVAMVQKHVAPGDSTIIVFRDAHWIAERAGVNNVFPFAHDGSLIIKAQVESSLAQLTRLPRGRERVFGLLPFEMSSRLQNCGFRVQDQLGQFTVWSRSDPAAVGCR